MIPDSQRIRGFKIFEPEITPDAAGNPLPVSKHDGIQAPGGFDDSTFQAGESKEKRTALKQTASADASGFSFL
jgi:hypothetical protein